MIIDLEHLFVITALSNSIKSRMEKNFSLEVFHLHVVKEQGNEAQRGYADKRLSFLKAEGYTWERSLIEISREYAESERLKAKERQLSPEEMLKLYRDTKSLELF